MQFSYTGISRTVLERPEWQPLIARVGASVGELARGIDRVEYVERVCLDVISARVRPRHPYPSRFLTAAGSASSDGLQAAGGREVTV